MRRAFFLSLCMALLLTLGACGAEQHVWAEATCTKPRSCSTCGKTEGMPLGHDADGEPNYQQALVCSRCGAVLRERLAGDFEKAHIPINLSLNKEAEYYAACASQAWHKTTGTVCIQSDELVPPDDSNGLLPAPEGYEWHRVTASAVFNDSKAQTYGVHLSLRLEDRYTTALFDSSAEYSDDTGFTTHQISCFGKEAICLERVSCEPNDWVLNSDGVPELSYRITLEYCVPQGYDGIVLGFLSPMKSTDESLSILDLYTSSNFLAYAPTGAD